MNVRRSTIAIGISAILSLSACVPHKDKGASSKCDHASPKSFKVNIILGNTNTPPMAKPEILVACYEDDVIFEIPNNSVKAFEIDFKKESPFGQKVAGKGKSKPEKIIVNPRTEMRYEYRINVEGYPEGDPYIRIKPR